MIKKNLILISTIELTLAVSVSLTNAIGTRLSEISVHIQLPILNFTTWSDASEIGLWKFAFESWSIILMNTTI